MTGRWENSNDAFDDDDSVRCWLWQDDSSRVMVGLLVVLIEAVDLSSDRRDGGLQGWEREGERGGREGN